MTVGFSARQQGCVFEDAGVLCSLLGRGNVYPCEDGIAAPWTDFTLLHFCGFCSVTGRSVGKPEKVQHQKCTEGGKKAKDSFRISEN